MPINHEIATLTPKGQVTLPRFVRQLLGLETGSKITFDVRDSEVVISRADAVHEDPAIGAFLDLLEAGQRSGRNLTGLPEDLAQIMLAHAGYEVNLDDEIDGEVAL